MTEKFTAEKCMTQCVTLCMTQNMGASLLKIGVYDTKMYDTKCKTVLKPFQAVLKFSTGAG